LSELNNARKHGDIDIAIGVFNKENNKNIHTSSILLNDYRIGVTNIANPIYDIRNLENKTVGFLKDDISYKFYEYILNTNNTKVEFFDTLSQAYDALEKKQIDMVIQRNSMKGQLINRENLKVEFSFYEKLVTTSIRLATEKESMYPFIDIVDNLLEYSSNNLYKDI